MSRRLSNFIDSFVSFATIRNTTPRFARWCGLWMIGTAVTRAVGMKARGNDLHPNLFLQLIGGPGTGKGQGIRSARDIFVPGTKMTLIPASITRAGMEDYMKDNLATRKSPDGSVLFSHECVGLTDELQGILPENDLGHLTLYNLLFDLPVQHKARTRLHGEIVMEAPYCSLLTGAQPAFLATTLPELAWGMGFMSRNIMIFDIPRERKSAFGAVQADPKLQADLIADLRHISKLSGWMTWTREAIALYEEWFVEHGGMPIPQSKRLAMGYNARREIHMLKMAMILSLAETDDLIVTLAHAGAAIELLLNTEDAMKNIFTEMSNTGSMVALEDALEIVRTKAAAGEPTAEATLIELLMSRFPPTQVHAVIQNLIDSHAIKEVQVKGGINAKGFRNFMPGSRSGTM